MILLESSHIENLSWKLEFPSPTYCKLKKKTVNLFKSTNLISNTKTQKIKSQKPVPTETYQSQFFNKKRCLQNSLIHIQPSNSLNLRRD